MLRKDIITELRKIHLTELFRLRDSLDISISYLPKQLVTEMDIDTLLNVIKDVIQEQVEQLT